MLSEVEFASMSKVERREYLKANPIEMEAVYRFLSLKQRQWFKRRIISQGFIPEKFDFIVKVDNEP